MRNLDLSYDLMASEAQVLLRVKQEIVGQLNMMRGRVENLISNGFVTDLSSTQFLSAFEEFHHGAAEAIDGLDRIAAQLEVIARTFAEQDEQLGRRLDGDRSMPWSELGRELGQAVTERVTAVRSGMQEANRIVEHGLERHREQARERWHDVVELLDRG